MLLELKIHDHGLSPLPMQSPHSKLMFGTKIYLLTDFQNFCCTYYDKLISVKYC